MIRPYVTVNPLSFMVVVIVLIPWRLDCGIIDCQSVSADPSAEKL